MHETLDLKNAVGCFDAVCPNCKARIGWRGTLADRPPCRQCGHLETVDLDDEQRRLQAFDAFCRVQTLYHDYDDAMTDSEKLFVRNMYRRFRDMGPGFETGYTDEQLTGIKRIYNSIIPAIKQEVNNDQ